MDVALQLNRDLNSELSSSRNCDIYIYRKWKRYVQSC